MTDIATLTSIGDELVTLCRQGKYGEAINKLYADDVVTVEPCKERHEGIEAVRNKNQWWFENFEVHRNEVSGPFPHQDRFTVVFQSEVTHRPSNKPMSVQEVAVYTVKDSKIAQVKFFYDDAS